MRYRESVEDSIALFKKVMPLMARHAAPMNPVSFTVWYEYAAGINPELSSAIDALLKNQMVLDEQSIMSLYSRFIASERGASVSDELPSNLQRIISATAMTVAETGTQVQLYDTSLQQFSRDLTTEAAVEPTETHRNQGSFFGRVRNLFRESPPRNADAERQHGPDDT